MNAMKALLTQQFLLGLCKHGVCSVDISKADMTYAFQNLGIQCVRKKDAPESLDRRQKIKVDPFKQGFGHKGGAIDLNMVRLCFQVNHFYSYIHLVGYFGASFVQRFACLYLGVFKDSKGGWRQLVDPHPTCCLEHHQGQEGPF